MKHTDPTKLRNDGGFARAPYNFVPLPNRMVAAPPDLPSGEAYHPELHTGWVECTLETRSPLYIRGMLTQKQFEAFGELTVEKMTPEQIQQRAPFFNLGGEKVEGRPEPVIPGSSLRGMLRSLVEVIAYGRMRWVAPQPTFTYRAVAAKNDDPLREPYRQVIGQLAANVRAGYLMRQNDTWLIRPARTPSAKEAFLKIPEQSIPDGLIPGLLRFRKPNYKPGYCPVSFSLGKRNGSRGPYLAVTEIGLPERGLPNKGMLVWSGSMLEGVDSEEERAKKLRRHKHTVILDASPTATPLVISDQAVRDYLAGLTPFQKELWGGEKGCLKDGAPVFYVEPEGGSRLVTYFGASPNFRIPARLSGGERAATPRDFIPDRLRSDPRPDFADALFGWVEELEEEEGEGKKRDRRVIGPPGQRAGRVFVGDARYQSNRAGVWLSDQPVPLQVLSGPKPTTFQHYLVQNKSKGHDPDNKVSLAHYGTPRQETEIRGHKFYWVKGASPEIRAKAGTKKQEKHHTLVTPLKPGVTFKFRLDFENLRSEELGALLWALTLPGEPGREYCHRLGMGKPLGMGVVKLVPQLYLTDRSSRYTALFDERGWELGAGKQEDLSPYIGAFEAYMFGPEGLGEEDRRFRQGAPAQSPCLADLERIQALLLMLEWREGEAAWQDFTRYMEIERQGPGAKTTNEYKERPVLPTPAGVVALYKGEKKLAPPGGGGGWQNRPPQPAGRERSGAPRQPARPEQGGWQYGVVDRFGMGGKPYGFIRPDSGGRDVFVHANELRGGLRELRPGQRVKFRPVTGKNGLPAAADVYLED